MLKKKINSVVVGILLVADVCCSSVSVAAAVKNIPVDAQQTQSMDAKQKLAQKLQQRHQQARQPKVQPAADKVKTKSAKPVAKGNSVKKQNVTSAKKVQQWPTTYMGVKLPQDYQNITIAGTPVATMPQAVAFLKKYNPKVKLMCTPSVLVRYYWEEATKEGVRPDLAFCQAIVETGFFSYGGDVKALQNNFCGLGTTGKGARGAKFATPQVGVRAHIQHLLAYSRKEKPKTSLIDPRYDGAHALRLQRGLVTKWSGLNGTWAMGSGYCEKIMYQYTRLLATVPGPEDTKAFELQKKAASSKKLTMRERVEQFEEEQKF